MANKFLKITILTLVVFTMFSTSSFAINYNESFDINTKYSITNNLDNIDIGLEKIASGFNSPVALTHAGDGTNRLFVVDQIGYAYVIENGVCLEQPFLDISDEIVNLNIAYDERGFLGMTFHPDYEENGKFYVYYSAPKTSSSADHESIVSEFLVSDENPNIADPDSEQIIFRIDQPEDNHNGGHMEFGPDGYLYIGLGDGGGAGDKHGTIGNGQDINTLLGSIIRIDVDGGFPYSIPADNPFVGIEGLDEIYAYGMRNPWKFSFDSLTGELFVGDVGQDQWEEVDIVLKGGNYGWRIMEGTHFYDEDLLETLGLTIDDLEMPIDEYDHDLGKSITGGYVYRKNISSQLYGKYIFADWSSVYVPPSGILFYLEETSPDNWERFELFFDGTNNLGRYILSFGQDESEDIYILSKTTIGPTGKTGDIRKIYPDNQNPEKPIITGPSNGLPDEIYTYKFTSTDPNDDNLFYFINWGDGNCEEWIGPFPSGEEISINHSYEKRGSFLIKAKSRDINNLESKWEEKNVRIPKTKNYPTNLFSELFRILLKLFQMIKISI
jgi:glucose/arabinose dehydrogenase